MFFHFCCLNIVILYGGILEFAASHTNTVARVGQSVNMSWSINQAFTDFKIYSTTYYKEKLNPNDSTVQFVVRGNQPLPATFNTHTENGTRIQLSLNPSLEGRNLVSLTFRSVDVQDAEVYTLGTHGSDLSREMRTQLLIVLQKPSKPRISTTVADPVSGDPVNLTCSTTSRSLPLDRSLYEYTLNTSYTWRRNNRSVDRNVDDSVHVAGQFLAIDHVTKEGKGVYTCQSGEEGLLSDWSQGYTLNVLYGPDTVLLSDNQDESEGDPLEVRCSADCNPACTVTWWNISRQTVITGQGEAVLSIPAVYVSVSGLYTCHVNNSHGSASRNLTLDIQPSLPPRPGSIVGVPVAVVCSFLIITVAVIIVIYVRKKGKKGDRQYRVGEQNMEDNENQFRQDPSHLYAKVNKKRRREVSDVYATVQKPKLFINRMYEGAGASSVSERKVLISGSSEQGGYSNCGETNEDGLIYADLALEPPILIDGNHIIHRREEPVVYEEIDFALTPGPQLPDKIWEVEEQEEEERRQCFWE